ncbi:hypothetical protein PUN28_017779 [Cardiocondyla obscurior]|uniref:Uncharacterized protein n=1 Tax=Cardiocondyla obscurior TaxID=286306 RepID=A0AAW2EN14_9HYME
MLIRRRGTNWPPDFFKIKMVRAYDKDPSQDRICPRSTSPPQEFEERITLDFSFSSKNLILETGDGVGSGKSRSGREIELSSARDLIFSGSVKEREDGERGKEQVRNLFPGKQESETINESGVKEGDVR